MNRFENLLKSQVSQIINYLRQMGIIFIILLILAVQILLPNITAVAFNQTNKTHFFVVKSHYTTIVDLWTGQVKEIRPCPNNSEANCVYTLQEIVQ